MYSWPTLEIPPSDEDFPELKLTPTWGKEFVRKNFNIYVCGITPYDATHLGHAATYITFDLINRYQILRKLQSNFIENITDVDDPLLERAKRDGVDWKVLAESQTSLFIKDMTALRVLPPRTFLSVSETINLVIEGILKLLSSDVAYEINGDFYYDISNQIKNLPLALDKALQIFGERGGDPNRAGKRHPLDPLLWRKHVGSEPGWDSPFGKGRPGWHIECAVIAIFGAAGHYEKGEPILNLQGGGSDLIFPHHFMTKVIAEDLTDADFAAQYVHTGMLGLEGEKMSKSKGNLVFVHRLLEEGIDPMAIRIALINGNYSDDRMWSRKLLDDANEILNDTRNAIAKSEVAITETVIKEMIEALANNLNTSKVLQVLKKWNQETLSGASGGNAGKLSRFLDSALGLAI